MTWVSQPRERARLIRIISRIAKAIYLVVNPQFPMESTKRPSVKAYQRLLPLGAMALFVVFYLLAAWRYPGGSWVEPGREGFSFRYNYLCDLLDTRAVGGAVNAGRYWARASLGVLCAGLCYLWVYLPALAGGPSWNRHLMRASALAALLTMVFLTAGTHDLTVRIAGVFGGLALVSAIAGLWQGGRRVLALFGAWCLAVFLLNYALYETGSYLRALPLIQKVTFLSFIGWFAWLDLALYRYCRMQGPLMN